MACKLIVIDHFVHSFYYVFLLHDSFYFLALFLALLEHKQVLRGLESNKQGSVYTKNLIGLACSVRGLVIFLIRTQE